MSSDPSFPGAAASGQASPAPAGGVPAAPFQGAVIAGFEGGAAPSPAVEEGLPIRNVAGPLPGESSARDADFLTASRAKGGRPRSAKVDMLPVKVSHHCNALLRQLPGGVRGATVERAIIILLEGHGVTVLERALPELSNMSARLQQVLEWLARGSSLTPDQKMKTEAAGAAIVLHLKRLLLP